MTERVMIETTRERAEALREHLSNDYLGHTKRQELVRALLLDVEKALPKSPATPPFGLVFPTKQ